MKNNLILCCMTAVLIIGGCNASLETTLPTHKAVVANFFDAYNSRNFDRLDDLMTPDAVRHSQSNAQVQGLTELKNSFIMGTTAFPDARLEILNLIAEDDLVAVRLNWTGTQQEPFNAYPALGKKARIQSFYLFRLADGKITECWYEFDNLTFLQQLGHFPGNSDP